MKEEGRMNQKKGKKKKEKPSKENILENDQPIPVVGIGASAGGLEALEKFFTNMPDNTGAAFVIIQHLAPDHKSILSELVSRYTEMAVLQIVDGMEIKPNTIYIIPPASDVSLKNDLLILSSQPLPRTLRLPIDSFFKTLAT